MTRRKFRAIACDKDGTLVKEESLTDRTRRALDAFRTAGGMLILATGETLEQLEKFDDVLRFELVIAENGAVLYWPRSKRSKLLTTKRPERLIPVLASHGVKLDNVGEVILSARHSEADEMSRAIEESIGDWVLILNRDEAMILPTGTDKATGLRAALSELGLRPDDVVGSKRYLFAAGLWPGRDNHIR